MSRANDREAAGLFANVSSVTVRSSPGTNDTREPQVASIKADSIWSGLDGFADLAAKLTLNNGGPKFAAATAAGIREGNEVAKVFGEQTSSGGDRTRANAPVEGNSGAPVNSHGNSDLDVTAPALFLANRQVSQGSGAEGVGIAGVLSKQPGSLPPHRDSAIGLLTLAAPAYLPVNADNDNGSAVTDGIPAKRDFSVSGLANPDPEIQPAVIFNTLPPGGTYVLNWVPGDSQVAFWQDQNKNTAWPSSWSYGGQTTTIWLEGTHESASLNDFFMNVTYTWGVGQTSSVDATLTVTPVINSFTVKDAPRQNVRFGTITSDITTGMTAQTLLSRPGALFDANLTVDNLSGNPVFIQNVMAMQNGANGTTVGGASVGASYLNGTSKANMTLPNGALPLVDAVPATPRTAEYAANINNDGHIATASSNDSPGLAPPPTAASVTAADYKLTLKLYLVWKYPSGVYYSLANYDWWTNFYATAAAGVAPANTVAITHGVTAAPDYSRSNADPVTKTNFFYNNNARWVMS